MLRRSLALGPLLAATFVVVGCQEPVTSPESAPLVPNAPNRTLSIDPSGFRATLKLPARVPSVDRVFGEYGTRAINSSDYVCSDESPVIDYVNTEIIETATASAAERERIITLLDLAADLVPTYEALFFQTTATPQTFGYNGEFTTLMTKTERDVKRFWDIPSEQIQVLAMHGTMLLDASRVSLTYQAVFGLDKATADVYAGIVRDALASSTTMNGGNYALWTFNSVAFRYDGLPDKIVMGDGILEAFASIGFSDVAPQAIFAHEFAHQIQYQNEYFDDLGTVSGAEATRYTELMADAMAAYYLTHARGGAMNQKRVEQFLEVFYQIGDCSFASSGHHGTPNQRLAAAQFGFRLADEAQQQGHILTSEEFHTLFLAYYPTLIAPDAP
jgi:hypothetical protein